MIIKDFLQQIFIPTESDDLEDIRHDIITSILALMVFVAWLNLWAALHYRQPGYFWATVILITGTLGKEMAQEGTRCELLVSSLNRAELPTGCFVGPPLLLY